MELRHLGYACINLTLNLTTGRTFRLASLSHEKTEDVTRENLHALRQILEWNVQKGIHLFRISSSFVPFASHENFTFNWQNNFEPELAEIKHYVNENNIRLSIHPGQYTVLNSPNNKIVNNAIAELEWSAQLMHVLDPENGVVVLHTGGVYGNKQEAMERFISNYRYLSAAAQRYLVLENDDKSFNLNDVLHICHAVKMPLVFDIFHHKCLHGGAHWQQDLLQNFDSAIKTWNGRIPKLHISSQKEGTKTSHADYITQNDFSELLQLAGQINSAPHFDLMVEAKHKEKAALRLLNAR